MSATHEERWFALPSVAIGATTHEAEVRPWAPGDGLACRGSKQAKRIQCGAPVAVVRGLNTRDYGRQYGGSTKRVVTSVYCERHIAELVRRQVGDSDVRGATATQSLIRTAEETVLAAHWAEYQEALAAAIEQQREQYLRLLPEWLREGFAQAEEAAS